MNKQNILFLSSELIGGGTEEIILSLSKYLNPNKYNICVASLNYGPMKEIFNTNKIEIIKLTGNTRNEKINNIKEYIDNTKIDFIFCNYFPRGHLITPDKVQTIEIVHSPYPWLVNDDEYRTALNKAAKIVCVSKIVYQYMNDHFKNFAGKTTIIENGIDIDKLKTTKSKRDFIKELNIPENHIIIGNLGRICPVKGIERIVEIARILNQKYDNLTFIIPGNCNRNPNFFSKIKQKIDKYKITNILFPGFIKNVGNILQIYDIFIFPSYHKEGVALALIEALKMGLPIVTTNVGIAKYDSDICNGNIGYIVNEYKYTDELFSTNISKLIDNKELRKKIGKNNKMVFHNKYLASDMVRQYEELLEELAQKQ